MTEKKLLEMLQDINSEKEWSRIQIDFTEYYSGNNKISCDEKFIFTVKNISSADGKKWLTKAFTRILGRNYCDIYNVDIHNISNIFEADSREAIYENEGIKWMSCNNLKPGDYIGFMYDNLDLGSKSCYTGTVEKINHNESELVVQVDTCYSDHIDDIPFSDTISMKDNNNDVFYFYQGVGPDWELLEADIELQS